MAVSVGVLGVRSVCSRRVAVSVSWSLADLRNLVLRRDAGAAASAARRAAGTRAHLRHAPAARRHAARAAAGAAVSGRAVGRGDDGRARRGGVVGAAARRVPAPHGEGGAGRADRRRRRCRGPLHGHGAAAARRRWTRALALPAVSPWRWRSIAVVVGLPGLGVDGAGAVSRRRARCWRSTGSRSLGHRVADGWLVARTGSLERRRDCIARAGIIGWTVRQTCLQRRAGVATLIAATAAGRKHYQVFDVPAESAWSVAAQASPWVGAAALSRASGATSCAETRARLLSAPWPSVGCSSTSMACW